MIPNNKSPKTILNHKTKPDTLRNYQWQALLRKQFAHIQKLNVTNIGKQIIYSEFEVYNPETKNKYNVAIRSVSEPKNFCSCLDFKTNNLGTCKHIEAVFFNLESNKNFETEVLKNIERNYTSIYVDYTQKRNIRIRVGVSNSNEIRQLTQNFFNADNALNDLFASELSEFIETYKTKFDLKIYGDAATLLSEIIDRKLREKIMDDAANNNELELLLNLPLRKYQENALVFALKNGKTILTQQLGMGLGITTLAIVAAAKKYFNAKKLLFVTDNINYWQRKIKQFVTEQPILVEGNEYTRKKLFDASSETIRLVSSQHACTDLKHINKCAYDFIVFDNADLFANLNNSVGKQLKTLQSKFSLLIATENIDNRIEEFYSQIQLVDIYLLGSAFNFTERYGIKNAEGKIIATKNENELQQKISNTYLSISLNEVLDTQDTALEKKISIQLNVQQQNLYTSQALAMQTKFLEKQTFSIVSDFDEILKTCTSGYLHNSSNCESKLPIAISLLKNIRFNLQNVIIVTHWPQYVSFINTFLHQSGLVSNNQNDYKLSVESIGNINFETNQMPTCYICLDALSSNALIKNNKLSHSIVYSIIAENTIEDSFYNLHTESATNLEEFVTTFFSHKLSVAKNETPTQNNPIYGQLSFLGDDDVIENFDDELEDARKLIAKLDNLLANKTLLQKIYNHHNTTQKIRNILNAFTE